MAADLFGLGSSVIGLGLGIAGTAMHKGLRVPPYQPVDLTASQAQTIGGNLANVPEAEKLASRTTTFNEQQLINMLRAAIPNYDALQKKTGENISSMLAGELPADVAAQVRRQAAAKSMGGGYGGSGMARNLATRDLGLTSLDLTTRGLDAASRWIAQTSQEMQPAFMSSSSMFFTPQQRVTLDIAQREQQWKAEVMKEQAANQQANLWSNFLTTEGAVLQGYGMGMMGGLGSNASMAGMSGDFGGGPYGEGNWYRR